MTQLNQNINKTKLDTIQKEARYTKFADLYAVAGNSIDNTVDNIIEDLYYGFLDEADDLDVYSFDMNSVPFDVNDEKLESVDKDSVTIADLLQLMNVARQMEDSHQMPYYESCISRRILRTISETLYQAFNRLNGNADEKPYWYQSLCINIKEFLNLYKERLAEKYSNNGDSAEYIIRGYDAEKMVRWIVDNDQQMFKEALEQWPVVNLLERLLIFAKECDMRLPSAKHVEYVYEFLTAIIYNIFGEFWEV